MKDSIIQIWALLLIGSIVIPLILIIMFITNHAGLSFPNRKKRIEGE
jgi:hypothetical protein